MWHSIDRHPSARSTSRFPKLRPRGRNADASALPERRTGAAFGHFTVYRGHKECPLQFDGEVLAEAQISGVAAGYRAAVYKTRDGNFISEFSLISMPYLPGGDPAMEGKVAVFNSLDAACAWFRSGPLPAKLMKQVGKWSPDLIK